MLKRLLRWIAWIFYFLFDLVKLHNGGAIPQNFDEFLETSLNRTSILEYKIKPLTKLGDNFNFILQALEVKSYKDVDSDNPAEKIETIHLVCKSMQSGPVTAEHAEQFLKEIHFYTNIVPAMQQFEQNANISANERIDAFVQYFGSRLSLNPDATNADSDAVMIFENLKSLGYTNSNPWDSFSRGEILATSKRLAKMHALIIGMRRIQPTVFYRKVNPYLYQTKNFSSISFDDADEFVEKMPTAFPNMSTSAYISLRDQFNRSKQFVGSAGRVPETPYTTISHRDLWTKNIMIKKAVRANIGVKILDFGEFDYESFAFDLTFVLMMNARPQDLREHFTPFISYYISEFQKTLASVDCPLDDYTDQKMWNEIREKAKLNLSNIYLYLILHLHSHQIQSMNQNTDQEGKDVDYDLGQPIPQKLLNKWNCINDVHIMNKFI